MLLALSALNRNEAQLSVPSRGKEKTMQDMLRHGGNKRRLRHMLQILPWKPQLPVPIPPQDKHVH